MSGDVLSQQTHRRALVGVPWQLAAAGTWKGMPGPGCQPPPGLQGPSSASASCSQSGGVETVLPGPHAGRTGSQGQRPAHWKGPRTQRGARGSALPAGGRAPSSRFSGGSIAHTAGSIENTHGVTSHLRKRSRTSCEPGPGAACPLPSLGQHVGLPVPGSMLSSSGPSAWTQLLVEAGSV